MHVHDPKQVKSHMPHNISVFFTFRHEQTLIVFSPADSDSNLDTDSDDDDGKDEEMDTDSDMDRMPLKLTKSSVSILDSSHSTSPAPLNLQVHKTPATAIVTNSGNSANHSPALSSYSVATPPGISAIVMHVFLLYLNCICYTCIF